MREFRKKQKRLYKIMMCLVVFTAVYILVYIGIQPTVVNYSSQLNLYLSYVTDISIIASLVVIFLYYNKYGKSDSFLERTECEIDDYAYYYTADAECDETRFLNKLSHNLAENHFNVLSNIEAGDFEFDVFGFKKKEMFYAVNVESVSRNDVLAYLDAVVTDVTVQRVKRSGNIVLCFVTDNAQEDAVAISKMITPIGKKEQLKIAMVIIEPGTRKCYFLGNMQTKCQQMILQFVLNTNSPIPEKLKGERRMKFQDDLEEKMKSFNIKEFKDGVFYSH